MQGDDTIEDQEPRENRPQGRLLSQLLQDVAGDPAREHISVADLLHALRDRALAALIFIFAFPNAIPMPPGTSAIVGAPLLFLTVQLAFGLPPWLPQFIARRSIARRDFERMVRHVVPWLQRAERLLRPRLSALARPPFEHLVGLVCLLLAVILVLPIPLGNMLPALAIAVMSLGILERDGVWVAGGCVIAAAGVALVWGVLAALVKSALYLFAAVLS
ncbi:exopolysaccharide biosynthesis protein [Schlegelella sp. S2-27]|uniref:Exopolysaccharide biosynthesis protein n=1 Tax=Caldimonas mangrovi TaxID=2944811 RepID=A0ABT0YUD6_9BURK|nr:exopolysaccharide biosynthesis protein [Caldimonas mangrovi]MCM5682362.1 exopolysaccharide biosynthesis protein [Caldimonas mangrovi]